MNKRNSILFHLSLLVFWIAAATAPLAAQGRGQGGGRGQAPGPKPGPIRRLPDGKPDLTGYYSANSGGANYGLEKHDRDFLTPEREALWSILQTANFHTSRGPGQNALNANCLTA